MLLTTHQINLNKSKQIVQVEANKHMKGLMKRYKIIEANKKYRPDETLMRRMFYDAVLKEDLH